MFVGEIAAKVSPRNLAWLTRPFLLVSRRDWANLFRVTNFRDYQLKELKLQKNLILLHSVPKLATHSCYYLKMYFAFMCYTWQVRMRM